jgi:hypothetical protein
VIKTKKIKTSKNLTGGQAAVQSLKKEKVRHVFGLIGSATMEMFDALYHEKKIKFIGVRDERTGAHMADGYARASNKPGVILAGQNGPGATNLVTGIAQLRQRFHRWCQLQVHILQKIKFKMLFKALINNLYLNQSLKKRGLLKIQKKFLKFLAKLLI